MQMSIVYVLNRSSQAPPPPSLMKPLRRGESNYQMVFINDKWLTLEKELGQGEFGSVLKGIYRPPNESPVRQP